MTVGAFSSDADNLRDLGGWSPGFGISAGEVGVVGVERTFSISETGRTVTTSSVKGGLGFDVGIGLIAEGHAGTGYAFVGETNWRGIANWIRSLSTGGAGGGGGF